MFYFIVFWPLKAAHSTSPTVGYFQIYEVLQDNVTGQKSTYNHFHLPVKVLTSGWKGFGGATLKVPHFVFPPEREMNNENTRFEWSAKPQQAR